MEIFLTDPSQLNGHENEDTHFAWMRAVNPIEAQNTLANWERILSKPRPENKSRRNAIEEWIFEHNPTYKNEFDFLENLEPIETEESPSTATENELIFQSIF